MKPTMPRSTPIAEPASRMPVPRNSRTSSTPAGRSATASDGSWNDAIPPTTNTTNANAADHAGPPMSESIAPNAAPPIDPTADSNANFELASTNCCSDSTSLGTSARFAITYVFCRINMTNASGNNNRLWMWFTIKNATAARPNAAMTTMVRRPPRARSTAGPINGVTTAKGAMVRNR